MALGGYRKEFLDVLCDHSEEGNRRWLSLGEELLAEPSVADHLCSLLEAIGEYDDVFGSFLDHPVQVPAGTIIVSGSGKETLKTFNVSTTAAIIAAAAGVRIVVTIQVL